MVPSAGQLNPGAGSTPNPTTFTGGSRDSTQEDGPTFDAYVQGLIVLNVKKPCGTWVSGLGDQA